MGETLLQKIESKPRYSKRITVIDTLTKDSWSREVFPPLTTSLLSQENGSLSKITMNRLLPSFIESAFEYLKFKCIFAEYYTQCNFELIHTS